MDPTTSYATAQLRGSLIECYQKCGEAQVAISNYLEAYKDAVDAGLTQSEFEGILADSSNQRFQVEPDPGVVAFADILDALRERKAR